MTASDDLAVTDGLIEDPMDLLQDDRTSDSNEEGGLPILMEEHSYHQDITPYDNHHHQSHDGDDSKPKRLVNALSQEEMLSLLPEVNEAYGFGARATSISCRFIRPEGTKDKFKTIGLGGMRVSNEKLDVMPAVINGHPHPPAEGQSPRHPSPSAIIPNDRPQLIKRESSSSSSSVHSKAPLPPRSLANYLKEHLLWVVNMVDDAIMAMTAPMASQLVALVYKLPKATNAVDFEKDLRMPLKRSPGESLAYMFIHPRNNIKRKYPTILVRNPYGRITFFYSLYPLAERGYNVLIMDVRGRGESTGTFDCITDYQDSLDTLEWIQSQPWYSPKHGVGLVGLSFNGFVLWSTFKKGTIPPCVKAIVPMNTTSRLSSINYRDGPLNLELVIRWAGYLWTITRGGSTLAGLFYSLMRGTEFLGFFGLFDFPSFCKGIHHLPVEDIMYSIKGVRLNRWMMFLSPPGCEFTKMRCASGGLRADTPPAQIHASWYDIFLTDSLFDFTTLVQKGNKDARIIISKHAHMERYFAYGELVKYALEHFRRYLRPDKQPYPSTADRVRIQVLHSNEWIHLPDWPPATTPAIAFFSADGKLYWDSQGDDKVVSGGRRYVYQPANPTPSIGGNGIGFLDAGGRDQARLERRDGDDILLYTSDVLMEDMLLVGYPKISVWVRCESLGAMNADFVARLCDVLPDGKSINICDGITRVCFAELPRDSRGTFRVDIQTYPTAVRLRKGHRIRFHIASAAFWRWERNLMAYGYQSLIPVRFEVLHGPSDDGSQSHVSLPVFIKTDTNKSLQPLNGHTSS